MVELERVVTVVVRCAAADWRVLHDQSVSGRHCHSVLGDKAT